MNLATKIVMLTALIACIVITRELIILIVANGGLLAGASLIVGCYLLATYIEPA